MSGVAYILASQRNGTLYTGVTADLPGRLHQHRCQTGSKFVRKYGIMRLVWYEEFPDIQSAIAREKAIKGWPRKWKIELIEGFNPTWSDRGTDWVLG